MARGSTEWKPQRSVTDGSHPPTPSSSPPLIDLRGKPLEMGGGHILLNVLVREPVPITDPLVRHDASCRQIADEPRTHAKNLRYVLKRE